MSTEPYVPPKIGFVRAEMHTGDGAWKKLTEAEFDRFIAHFKAEALREASRGGEVDAATHLWLRERADRIEEEA